MAKDKAAMPFMSLLLRGSTTAAGNTSLSNIALHLQPIGCKLWLLSIQNHARHRFKAFARRHLKLLVLFDSNLSRCPSLGQVIDLDLMLC